MNKRSWLFALAAVLAVVVALGAGVTAQAQESPSDGVTVQDLGAAQVVPEGVGQAPDVGRFLEGKGPGGAFQGQPGEMGGRMGPGRPGHPGDPGRMPRRGMMFHGDIMEVIAEQLGMEVDELIDALRNGKTIEDLASEKGVSLEDIEEAILNSIKEKLDELVADGKMTQERADAILERISEHIGDMLAGEHRMGPRQGGPRHGGRGAMMRVGQEMLKVVAQTLGMEVDDLMAELRDGKTIADVAAEQGVSLDDIEAAILASIEAKLDQLVSDGKLTQEQADQILERVAEHIGDMLTKPMPHPGRGQPGRRGGCGGHGDVGGFAPNGIMVPSGAL